MQKMAARLLQLLALWTTAVGVAQACPEQCTCQDKFSHQFADCAYKDLLVVPVGLPSNVTTISLSANKIKLLRSKSFVSVLQVSSLWLAHNEIVTIERGTLAPLVQLKNLDISHNKIIHFPWEDLRNLSALQLLKINHNEMVNLPKDAFASLGDLRSLRINNNKFTTIVEGTFQALTAMSHLQISNNPFSCSCSLEWLRDWITSTKIAVADTNLMVCDAPEHLKGTLVTKIPVLECQAPAVTITYDPDLREAEVYEGTKVVLNCEAVGSPEPQVRWEVIAGNQNFLFPLPTSRDNTDTPINDKTTNNRFLIFQNGSLVIPRVTKKEDGNYSCSAVNDVGKAESVVRVALSGARKQGGSSGESTVDRIRPNLSKSTGEKNSKNNVIDWDKTDKKISPAGPPGKHGEDSSPRDKTLGSKCGVRHSSEYISNHAFNMTLDDLKQYTYDFGVIALEVSETEAKVKLNPLQLSSKSNLHLSTSQKSETVNKEPLGLYQSASGQAMLDMLYLCVDTGNGHSVVQWSNIEEGVNSYRFHGLQPGTNYTLCLTYGGQDCQVQVVFTTRKKIPSLLIIVIVSIFLLGLATVPLLGATCCHLLYKYQGKPYNLMMKAQNPDQMEKQMTGDFNRRTSFVESEKTFNPSDSGEAEAEDQDGDGEVEGSLVTESIPGSSSKTNPEEFEVGSEYSDRLPLGAEAVNISEEINGNYKPPSR